MYEQLLYPVFRDPGLFAMFSFFLGLLVVGALTTVVFIVRRLEARAEARRLLSEANEHADEIMSEAKKRSEELDEQIRGRWQRESAQLEEKLSAWQIKIQNHESELNDALGDREESVRDRQSTVDSFDNKVNQLRQKVDTRRELIKNLRRNLLQKLESASQVQAANLTAQIQTKILENHQLETTKSMQLYEEDSVKQAETEAKKLLTMAINRFARPYCPERGIGYLNFDSEDQKRRVLANNQAHLRQIEKLCGVDLVYDEAHNAINVYGFDPVRREFGRALVEKVMNERDITSNRIEQLAAKTKRDLFQRILQDGNRVAKELRLEGLHQEIRNMMGALRYRYSFTQNQYFHCAEVGWLCGLLATELGVPVKDARRAGLLHDIGKAMDHTVEGGHAVIGADFIKQNGEPDQIVHAVRAHHYDETPDSDLAFLVIAADAISGSRPGARRSTVATYTQKIQDLQTIARGFDGVTDTHVLSAGREVRVFVDGRRLTDWDALELSKQIAQKIENEMQYPGQIKVTVVRETEAVELAR